MTVLPTGSMEPAFNQRAILLTEPARFDDLRVGDIVTYNHPGFEMPVVHRIVEKRGDRFWSKGDNNDRMDDVYITRENYIARVFAIIYARAPLQTASAAQGGDSKNSAVAALPQSGLTKTAPNLHRSPVAVPAGER